MAWAMVLRAVPLILSHLIPSHLLPAFTLVASLNLLLPPHPRYSNKGTGLAIIECLTRTKAEQAVKALHQATGAVKKAGGLAQRQAGLRVDVGSSM
jgi:hypothetical protein